MDQLFNVGLLSIPVVIFLGGLLFFWLLLRKSKPSKKNFNDEIGGYEKLFGSGKITKDEMMQIRMAMLKKHGLDLPPEMRNSMSAPKPIRPGMNTPIPPPEEQKKTEEKTDKSNSDSNTSNFPNNSL